MEHGKHKMGNKRMDAVHRKLTQGKAKEIMRKVVERFFDNVDCRDIGSILFKGYNIYLSGGMSWGDSPTDSYDAISTFNLLPTEILSAGEIE